MVTLHTWTFDIEMFMLVSNISLEELIISIYSIEIPMFTLDFQRHT